MDIYICIYNETGTGSICSSIAGSCGRQPDIVCGKPSSPLLELMIDEYSLDSYGRQQTLLVGDRLDTDIKFAESAGFTSVLTLTGCTSKAAVDAAAAAADATSPLPTFVVPSLGSMVGI